MRDGKTGEMVVIDAVFAALGAAIFYFLRNDIDEFGIGRAPWVIAAIAAFMGLLWIEHPNLDWWRYAICLPVISFLITWAHGPILQGPNQICSDTPDAIEKMLYVWWYKRAGDRMGLPVWLLYATARYIIPCGIIALAIDRPLYWLAGVCCVVGYWPLAHMIAGGEKTKFVGAAAAGAFIYGLV